MTLDRVARVPELRSRAALTPGNDSVYGIPEKYNVDGWNAFGARTLSMLGVTGWDGGLRDRSSLPLKTARPFS
jgi:hypothetical protein